VFSCTREARDFLLREGTDIQFGARHLKRSIERHLVFPISNLLATEQIQLGDLITLDFDALLGKLIFAKEDQGALARSEDDEPAEETTLAPLSVRAAHA
jgi:ATP-dependent Clp protease ATP-binding subunit ClpA